MTIVLQYGVPLLMAFKYGKPRGYVRDLAFWYAKPHAYCALARDREIRSAYLSSRISLKGIEDALSSDVIIVRLLSPEPVGWRWHHQFHHLETTYLETSRAEQLLSRVLIDVTVRVTGAAEPILFIASELLAIVGDSEPVTSTRCPR
jgi:hypothetical protein